MSRRRLAVVTIMLLLAAAGLVGRTLQVMIVDHREWQEIANRQQHATVKVPTVRGEITTADGFTVAASESRLAIQVETSKLKSVPLFTAVAAPVLGESEAELRSRLASGAFPWLAQRVEASVAERVQELAPAAVALFPDSQRVYPLGSVAAPVVGFVGREELLTVGRAGLESAFDHLLAGEPQLYLAVNDAIQRRVRLQQAYEGRPGLDLELTLHGHLQGATEAVLAETVTTFGATSASAVVLKVSTGEILALASQPSFDPAAPGRSSSDCWRLRPVQDAFEPGSTVKPFVVIASLAAGTVAPGETFDCRQRGVRVAGRWIRDHARPGFYTVDDIVVESVNAGAIMLAQRLPAQMLWGALDAFGFGRTTGVGFPGEAPGRLPRVEGWSKMSQAGLALGQELTVTPLQLALAYAAIANGGYLPTPKLVRRAGHRSGVTRAADAPRARVMDAALSLRLQTMLERVVLEGTGRAAAVPGYRAAGKTGTAQRAVDGRFDDTHHVAWFAGFLSMPDPSVVVVVAVEQPTADFWAASVAAPAFSRIAAAAAYLLDVPPSEPEPFPPDEEPEQAATTASSV